MTEVDLSIEAVNPSHYVDWGSIIAGAFVAVAVSTVFLAFGSAIGLSMTSFQSTNAASATGLAVAGALWLLWVQVSSFAGGGYIAGRMRRRIGDAKPHEVEMRDGTHGLIVWAVALAFGIILTGLLAVSGLSGAAKTINTDYYVEKLVRNNAALQSAVPTDNSLIALVLAKNLTFKTFDTDDKTYLVREISTRSGLGAPEAEKRLDETITILKSQADTARRFGILIAFLTAASLLVSAAAAWWAATMGGKHRDESTDHSRFTRWS